MNCFSFLISFAEFQVRVPRKYYASEIGIQCNVEARSKCDKAVQCEPNELEMRLSLPKAQSSPAKPKTVLDESFISTNENQNCSMEWMPSDDEKESDDEYEDGELESEIDDNVDSEINEKSDSFQHKFLVFEFCPLQLFTICNICLSPCLEISKFVKGSMLRIRAVCLEGHVRMWYSQPFIGDMPLGNFLIAACALLSGSQPAKVLLLFHHLKTPCIKERTYNLIQKAYLVPSILSFWENEQKSLIEKCKDQICAIGGDARMDSPGYSAKYGTYSLMDLDMKKIIEIQTVQVNLLVFKCVPLFTKF